MDDSITKSLPLSFDQFLEKSWSEHAQTTHEVAQNLFKGIKLLENIDHIGSLAHLACHVYGEHLGDWTKAIHFVEQLKSHQYYLEETSVSCQLNRLQLSMNICQNEATRFSKDFLSQDSGIRLQVLALSASALVGQNQLVKAKEYLSECMRLSAHLDVSQDQNIIRSLAISSNNVASALEEKKDLSEDEKTFMIECAQIARIQWGKVGTWLQHERAEYRLAKSYLKSQKPDLALKHAELCLDISLRHEAPALELFFACEILALCHFESLQKDSASVAFKKCENYFSKLNKEDQSWCEGVLLNLKNKNWST